MAWEGIITRFISWLLVMRTKVDKNLYTHHHADCAVDTVDWMAVW
jgi:hypothetical protein